MSEIPPVLTEQEMIQFLLSQHKNDLTKLEVEERYMRRLALKLEKFNHPLGQMQDQIKEKKGFISYLEEICETS